jgi:nucleoside-diphosphate-sugar epimerase
MNKVLLLGCTGEVGSRLCLKLLDKGFIVFGVRSSKQCRVNHINHSCKKIDLLNVDLSSDLKYFKPEIMVHTAWITTPDIFWDSSINDNWVSKSKRIIQEFEENGGKYLIATGTCAEYSWKNQEQLDETSIENPKTRYGKSKLELLNWIRSRSLPFLWTRTFFQFGLAEPVGRLIPSLIDNFLLGNKYVIKNHTDIRDFVYIKDIVEILSLLITQEVSGIVNIGSGNKIDIKSVSEKIAKLMSCEDLLHYESNDLQKSVVVSNPSKLIELIPKFTWTHFDSAIMETIDIRKRLLI